jgi:metal-responsive CopG/Arc/MetJ family transcriptional regulator
MSRNNERVLSDAMIQDIKAEMFSELEWSDARNELTEAMMNAYLTDDFDSLKQVIVDAIEHYEDEIILTLNMELNEDSFNQNEDNV